MRNFITLLLMTITSSICCYAQTEMKIDTTLNVDEQMELMMPNVLNERLYYATEKKDPAGNITEKRFLQKWNGKTANWVIHFEYNSSNLIVKEWNTDTLDNIVRAVVCDAPMTKYKYDKKGQLIEIAFFANEETPTLHDCAHFHKKVNEYDKEGRAVLNQFIGLKEKVQNTQSFKFDSKDRIVEVNLLDANKELIKDSPSVITIKYDDQNREIENRYFNWDRTPIQEADRLSYETFEYEQNYKVITYFNNDDQVLRKVKKSGNGIVSEITDIE